MIGWTSLALTITGLLIRQVRTLSGAHAIAARIWPVRIEIAQSGDLAYEFSNSDLIFDLKSGGRDVTTSSVLRVWKKEEGQWKIAALFARPHDVEAGAAAR